jgi:N-acetylmuramoyl-L-alanine amidase
VRAAGRRRRPPAGAVLCAALASLVALAVAAGHAARAAAPPAARGAALARVTFADGRGARAVPLRTFDGDVPCLAAGDVIEITRATSYWRSETRKLLLRIADHRLTLSADNPFILLDGQLYRLGGPPRFRDAQMWVPIAVFDILAAARVLPDATWDAATRSLALDGPSGRAPAPPGGLPPPDSLGVSPAAALRSALVVLDPGHGGADAGTRAAGGLREKDLTLELATRVARHLQRDRWFRVVLVRERDEQIQVPRRVEIANATGADLLVSLHADLRGGPNARRFRLAARPGSGQVVSEDLRPFVAGAVAATDVRATLSFKRWETAGTERGVESYYLAQIIAEQLESGLGGEPPALTRRPLWPLAGANMPAVLLEIGPPRGAAGDALAGGELLERTAQAIAAGIRRYWLGAAAPSPAPGGGRRDAEGQR